MRKLAFFIVGLALLFVASPAAALPDVEDPITITGDFQFAGVAASDPSPDLVEVAAIGEGLAGVGPHVAGEEAGDGDGD